SYLFVTTYFRCLLDRDRVGSVIIWSVIICYNLFRLQLIFGYNLFSVPRPVIIWSVTTYFRCLLDRIGDNCTKLIFRVYLDR
ncbi:hypothetical protein L9F63_023939, partial [Diploptera punctata]